MGKLSPLEYLVHNRGDTANTAIFLPKRPPSCMRKTKTIAILAMPGVQLLDVSGPLDVFAEANVQAAADAYALVSSPVPLSTGRDTRRRGD